MNSICRVRVHTKPPLVERRAWLHYPNGAESTIRDVKDHFGQQLGIEIEQIELSVDGEQLQHDYDHQLLNVEHSRLHSP